MQVSATVGPRPGDQRQFVHKRLLGAARGFLEGGPLAAVRGFVKAPPRARRPPPLAVIPQVGCDVAPWLPHCRPTIGPIGPGPCPPGTVRGPRGDCISPISPVGAARLGGEAIMGQYGAAMVAGSQIVDRATCLRGMQLGNDGLCYNKGQIRNNQRMWPAGRKPLLTGGDMRAISTAARAGKRMDLATKRLQKMGMMKKPAARRAAPSGHRVHLHHDESEH